MSTLLRDLITIPERAGADDYVLRLTEGVEEDRLAQTIEQYVVTDDIVHAFDQALDLIGSAIKDGQSRAAFLTGSFGSGKSHFMAVLHGLLGRDPHARAKPELAPVIADHDPALEGTSVLRLAFHFLEARSVEDVILGGYVQQIRALHPGCDLPAVHRGDDVLTDAERLRESLGDDAFFAGLNRHVEAETGDVWSGILEGSQAWTAETYDAARAASPGTENRQALVSALVRAYFSAYTRTAEFVSLDEGLTAISRHSRGLGYDAIVMFLDELVLWLAFSVRDRQLFGREAQKLTKLVESGTGPRAVPIVSFVARQMDLRHYFAQAGVGMGSEQEALDSAFRHQEGRFATIELGDANLPYVAEKRLLEPRDASARAVIDGAFASLERRPEVWDTLLDGVNTDESHRGADQAAFRRTYPFSPALVSTLRELASAMQRDRTALKVMQQLLVRRRDDLTVDDVIPVGDVFDFVVEGNQALTPEMKGRFANARKLYTEKLRPRLLRDHGLSEQEAAEVGPGHPFRADDRLVKTLVLSAVAPEVPALKELTASRLAALNHGSIVSPLPGQEASAVLARVRNWQSDVPELHVSGESRNPIIRVRIAEVDYESVIERAKGEDNHGRRRETLKQMVWELFGFDAAGADMFGVSRQPRVWRGSRRDLEVIFANVRDRSWLADERFEAGEDTWRFIVDYPFDEDGRSASEDLARLEELSARMTARTIAWVPHFLSRDRRDDLGRLVILDHLLSGPGERWASMADHLAEADRAQARTILESAQDALRDRLKFAVQQAYGAASRRPADLDVDEGHDRVLVSLDPACRPGEPVGHDLAAAFDNLVDQAFSTTFPAHPRFEPEDTEVRNRELSAVLSAVEAARQDPDGRAFVEQGRREAVRRVANPLQVGHMGETHFLFGADRFRWNLTFERAMGRDGITQSDPVGVSALRGWIDEVDPRVGLRREVAELVICAWAVLSGRAWYRHGGPVVPAPPPGQLTDDMELRPERLPAAGDWELAVPRVQALFGIPANQFLTGTAVTELTERVTEAAARLTEPADLLAQRLTKAYAQLGLPSDADTGRLATAIAGRDLVQGLRRSHDRVRLIEALARAELPTTEQAVAKSLQSAEAVARAVDAFSWDRLRPLIDAERGSGDQARKAKALLDRLRDALRADELAQSLQPALKRADDDAFQWALEGTRTGEEPEPEPTPKTEVSRGRRRVRGRVELDATVGELRDFVDRHPEEAVVVEWRSEP